MYRLVRIRPGIIRRDAGHQSGVRIDCIRQFFFWDVPCGHHFNCFGYEVFKCVHGVFSCG